MKHVPSFVLAPIAAILMGASPPEPLEDTSTETTPPVEVPAAATGPEAPSPALTDVAETVVVDSPSAEVPTLAETAPQPACELHVFPTLEGQAVTTGWLSGLGVIGAIAEASANKDRNINEAVYLKEALGPRLQVEAFKSLDLVNALKLPPSQIIYETPIADRDITTKAETRLSSSTAECYAELIVTQNFYQKRAIYGRSLNNRFIFKDFRMGKTKADLVKGRGGNGLTHFPPKTTDESEAAEQELRTVFAANFTEFANGVSAAR